MMNLIREHWNKKDIKLFQDDLKRLENPSKKEWTTNLLKTKLPVLCLTMQELKNIAKEIKKGNYLSFLDHVMGLL